MRVQVKIVEVGSEKYIVTTYHLAYQSIMELIIADKYAVEIISNNSAKIPDQLLKQFEYGDSLDDEKNSESTNFVNRRILLSLVSTLFVEYDKLIGDNDFLIEGLDSDQLADLQNHALMKAPPEKSKLYDHVIKNQFLNSYEQRYYVFNELIYPSSDSASNYYGADFLHEILGGYLTSFSKEKNWLGWDSYTFVELGEPEKYQLNNYNLKWVLTPNENDELELSPYALHNERPLIYGWSLATLDQILRHKLRVVLTNWGLNQPLEFTLLLNKLFFCKDPQIQEDLASITLGIIGKLKDKDAIKKIAEWSLKNVFQDTEKNVNIIVRLGFRSAVERAFQYGLITSKEAEKSRPKRKKKIKFLPLDYEVLKKPAEAIYPIVHDLAWYVIKKAYDDFIDYGFSKEKSGNLSPDELFLKKYADEFELDEISPHTWAMAAAIAYMKSLGFDRTEGNGMTKATHGSKSDYFTLEEKYCWLAVHYLQGYLADYLPLENGSFVQDYSEIVDISNPAEFIPILASDTQSKTIVLNEWVLQENLIQEFDDKTLGFDEAIRLSVESEPTLNFENWLMFNSADFVKMSLDEKLLCIHNYTTLHDSKEYVNTKIEINACLIEKGKTKLIKELISDPEHSGFARDVDSMHANPKTDIYSNPTDLVWMNWIEETETSEVYYSNGNKKDKLYYSVTSVTNDTIDGEKEIKIPSKKIRELLNVSELDSQVFFNNNEEPVGFLQFSKGENYDRQEMVLVNQSKFLDVIDKSGLEIVWFVDLLSHKNAVNDSIRNDNHPMKCRKYLVTLEGDKLTHIKYWDARYTNRRD